MTIVHIIAGLLALNAALLSWLWFDDRHARRARRTEEELFVAFEAQFAGSPS